MSKCTKIMAIILCCAILAGISGNLSYAKRASNKGKNKPVMTARPEPVEIDDEFKGEFKYFDPAEEKTKLKEEKKAAKIEKKHQKLIRKKKKLELKQLKSEYNVKKYTEYKEQLENSFLPNQTNTEEISE